MQTKIKYLYSTITFFVISITVIFLYTEFDNVLSKNIELVEILSNDNDDLRFVNMLHEDYLIKQFYFDQFYLDSVISMYNQKSVFNILKDSSLVILIPTNVCNVCVEDFINNVNNIIDSNIYTYILFENQDRNGIMIKNKIYNRNNKFHISGFVKIRWIKNLDKPVSFIINKNNIDFVFIPSMEIDNRTMHYLEFINSLFKKNIKMLK